MRDKIIKFIEMHRSDDLYRAKSAFRGCTKEQMQEQHGNSGQTRQQIVDGYQQQDNELNKMIEYLRRLK